MKKLTISMALTMLLTGVLNAQTNPSHTESRSTVNKGDQYCLTQADTRTWTELGLNEDQIERVTEIKMRYKEAKHEDRGTENTMRGTADDRATPVSGSRSGRDIATPDTEGKGLIRDEVKEARLERAADQTDNTTKMDRAVEDDSSEEEKETYGHTGTTRTSDQLGYDDTFKESMERELRTVLTTAQFDRYQEWCQDQDATRGDRMDMDR